MSSVLAFTRAQLYVAPVPATETIALFPGRSADTTRANSMLGLDVDLAQFGRMDGAPFRIVVSGNVTASASENITIAAYLNNASTPNTNLTTFTSDVKVLNTGTMATGAAGTIAFYHSTLGIWNSTSATAGRFAFYPEAGGIKSISGTSAVFVATAVIGNSGTAITSTQALCQFFVTTLTGTADASSVANIDFRLCDVG